MLPKPKREGPRRPICTQVLAIAADFGAGDGIRTHDPNLGKVVLPGLRRPWPSPRHVPISLPARLLAEELQKVGISRGKGPVRSEGKPVHSFNQNQAARGSGEAKSPRVRLNKCTSPKLRFTASRGSASAPPSTSHRPRGSLRPPLGSNPGPRCSLEASPQNGTLQRPANADSINERKPNVVLPYCYPTRQQRTPQDETRWTAAQNY